MLTTSLILVMLAPISWILQGVFYVLPDFDFLVGNTQGMQDAYAWFLAGLNYINPIIPTTTVLTVFGIVFSYYALLYGFRLASWVLRKIPFLDIT